MNIDGRWIDWPACPTALDVSAGVVHVVAFPLDGFELNPDTVAKKQWTRN